MQVTVNCLSAPDWIFWEKNSALKSLFFRMMVMLEIFVDSGDLRISGFDPGACSVCEMCARCVQNTATTRTPKKPDFGGSKMGPQGAPKSTPRSGSASPDHIYVYMSYQLRNSPR